MDRYGSIARDVRPVGRLFTLSKEPGPPIGGAMCPCGRIVQVGRIGAAELLESGALCKSGASVQRGAFEIAVLGKSRGSRRLPPNGASV